MIWSLYLQKKGKNEKALVTKEIELSHLGKNIFIGDSAAISNMTSNKTGVYHLVSIKGSLMIGNGKASAVPTRENWMSSASTRMDP